LFTSLMLKVAIFIGRQYLNVSHRVRLWGSFVLPDGSFRGYPARAARGRA
jgi:hypothetical protein